MPAVFSRSIGILCPFTAGFTVACAAQVRNELPTSKTRGRRSEPLRTLFLEFELHHQREVHSALAGSHPRTAAPAATQRGVHPGGGAVDEATETREAPRTAPAFPPFLEGLATVAMCPRPP